MQDHDTESPLSQNPDSEPFRAQDLDIESLLLGNRSSCELFYIHFKTTKEILSKQWVTLTCCTALAVYPIIGLLFTRLNQKAFNVDYFLIASVFDAVPLMLYAYASRCYSTSEIWVFIVTIFVLQLVASYFIASYHVPSTWGDYTPYLAAA